MLITSFKFFKRNSLIKSHTVPYILWSVLWIQKTHIPGYYSYWSVSKPNYNVLRAATSKHLTLDPQGKSFFHGVRFSVQTISLGKLAYRTCVENQRSYALVVIPRGRNANLGITVTLPSMKFNDAQKLPDKTLMRSIQTESMLHMHQMNFIYCTVIDVDHKRSTVIYKSS